MTAYHGKKILICKRMFMGIYVNTDGSSLNICKMHSISIICLRGGVDMTINNIVLFEKYTN